MRWASIVGARPQFVKIAPVCRAITRRNAAGGERIEDLIVHTGQHYDPDMSDVFFDELEIPRPAMDLGVGSAAHGVQTARMLEAIEKLLLDRRPDIVVVYGDTNSTVAGALAATKLHVPVAHVEAGLRSFNRTMPEEINRVATDHISDLLLAPTPAAMENLAAERLATRAMWTGDVMHDAVQFNARLARERSSILGQLRLSPNSYAVVTLHRAENTEARALRSLLETLSDIAVERLPVVFPVHPRTRRVLAESLTDWQAPAQLALIQPLGYLDMLRLVEDSQLVLTDSGGLQKEAFFLGRPCVTLRTETEWVETVSGGGNIIAGVGRDEIRAAVDRWLRAPPDPARLRAGVAASFGNGDAADRIVDAIADHVHKH